MKESLTAHQMHLLLVESVWGELTDSVNEILTAATLDDEALPDTISIPTHDKKTGKWVRLTLKISSLKEGEK